MIQTLEAIVDKLGNVSVLGRRVRLKRPSRALVTILDEEPKDPARPDVEPPTYEAVSDEEVLSVWAGRDASAQEIARKLREQNRGET